MKREMGIARCGLACCLCSGNDTCAGCNSGKCPDRDWCENRNCSIEKGIEGCYVCDESCSKGLLGKIKPLGFRTFIPAGNEPNGHADVSIWRLPRGSKTLPLVVLQI